jgi:hypothetical protein
MVDKTKESDQFDNFDQMMHKQIKVPHEAEGVELLLLLPERPCSKCRQKTLICKQSPLRSLIMRVFYLGPVLENTQWIDDDENAAASGEDGSLLIDNFGYTREAAPTFADLS